MDFEVSPILKQIPKFYGSEFEGVNEFLGVGLFPRSEFLAFLKKKRSSVEKGERWVFFADFKVSSHLKGSSYEKYGFVKSYLNISGTSESDFVRYDLNGERFESPALSELEMLELFNETGFSSLEAVMPESPEGREPFWDFFLENPAFLGFIASP